MSSVVATVPYKNRSGFYRIRPAAALDLDAILALQEEVLGSLSAEHRRYVFRRHRDHIEQTLNFAGQILLAESDEEIFATMLLTDVADTNGYLRALDMDVDNYVPVSFADGGIIMQSLLVRPSYHGQGIAQHMFATAVNIAEKLGVGFIGMAENRANKPAIMSAFKNGFSINGYGTHSAYGVPGYIFCKSFAAEQAGHATMTMQAESDATLAALVLALVAENNQIEAIDYTTQTVAFKASAFASIVQTRTA